MGVIDLPAVDAALPVFGERMPHPEDKMDYDWTGARTRRLALLKWTSLLLGAGVPPTLLLWLHFVQ